MDFNNEIVFVRGCTMKFAFVSAFLLFLMAVSVAEQTFSVSILGIEGARGRMVDDNKELDIGNCNMPQDTQNTVMALRMNYPSTCNGQMDVYYSYYDFSTGTYTQEKFACSVSSNENCKVTFNILFGGKGDGTEMLDKWAIFRAVCKKSRAEQTYSLPLRITHTETQFEKTLMPKIIAADQSVVAVKQSLSACPCCDEKGYTEIVKSYDSQLATLKSNVAKCDFRNIENAFNELKKNADLKKAEIDVVKCEANPSDSAAGTGTQVVVDTGTTQSTGNQGSTLPTTSQPASPCPAGAIIFVLLGGLALAKGIKF